MDKFASKVQRTAFREGYRLGLYAGNTLGKMGLVVQKPPECDDLTPTGRTTKKARRAYGHDSIDEA